MAIGLREIQRGSGPSGAWTPRDYVRFTREHVAPAVKGIRVRFVKAFRIDAVGMNVAIWQGLKEDPRELVRSVAHEVEHCRMTATGESFDLGHDEIERRARTAEDRAERYIFGKLVGAAR